MNDILSEARNFANQIQNTPAAHQESLYQEKYIAALEEKLKITQERDTMAKILDEKNAQLESLIKYSAELERKLGISHRIADEDKFISWIDVVLKYFKSFNDPAERYEKEVETFIQDRNISLQPVQSDSFPGKVYYGIPSSLHVEFAAFFCDLWQKGLNIKELYSSGKCASKSTEIEVRVDSQTGFSDNIEITVEEMEDYKNQGARTDEALLEESRKLSALLVSSSPSSPHLYQNIPMDLKENETVVSPLNMEEFSNRGSPIVERKIEGSPKSKTNLDRSAKEPERTEEYQEFQSTGFVPIAVTIIKEHKIKGITMYIWLELLNAYFPNVVKIMKGDKELYIKAKSATKRFLTDNYPSIGLSFKEMENQKLLYIPKSFEVNFKSWFKEEFNSGFKCLNSYGNKISESNEFHDNDSENVSAIKEEFNGYANIINGGSCYHPKKPKSNCVRYNLVLKDLFPDFHSQTKISRGRIRKSVKEYLSDKVKCLEDCKLLQKDRHGAIKVSYGVPRELLEDFQKWALLQLREEYGEIVPLADWE